VGEAELAFERVHHPHVVRGADEPAGTED